MTLQMVVPFDYRQGVAARAIDRRPPAQRPVLGLVDNGKIRAKDLLVALADELVGRADVCDPFVYTKSDPVPLRPEQVEAVVDRAGVVIVGVGDCGGCSSSSAIDALKFVERGIPTAVVATTPFQYVVDAVQRRLGLEGLSCLYVDHPIWTRDAEWFQANAQRLAAAFSTYLADFTRPAPARSDSASSTRDDPFAGLRRSLAADNYELHVSSHGPAYRFRVVPGPDSCAECLIPDDLFVQIAVQAARDGGLEIDPDLVVVER